MISRMLIGLIFLAPAAAQEPAPLAVDEKAGTVTFGAKATKPDQYEQLKGAIEYVIVAPKGKEYEACFVAPVDPIKLYEAIQKIGVKPGKPAHDNNPAEGGKLKITVEWKDGDKARKEPIESFVLDTEAGKPMQPVQWIFSGSKQGFDPETEAMALMVKSTKNLMGLYQGDGTTLITNPSGPMTGHRYKVNKAMLPKEGTAVKIIFEAAK